MNIIDRNRVNSPKPLTPEQVAWGNNIICKVQDGGMWGPGIDTYGFFQFFHDRKELHYLNGQLDDTFYLAASIFRRFGYSIHDKRLIGPDVEE